MTARGTPTAWALGTCPQGHTVTGLALELAAGSCRQCGGQVASCQPIEARPTLATCGDACWAAIGRLCECSCGGANHGGRWMVVRA